MTAERARQPSRSRGTATSTSSLARGHRIAAELIGELARRQQTLAVAESCTGGLLGGEITAVPGSSKVFWGGVIAYDNGAKTRLLGVPPAVLEKHGAVSEETARAMAEGIRERASSTWGLSITGVAGPDGGTDDRPVGTVWIGLAGPCSARKRFRFRGDRMAVRGQAVESGLESLLNALERERGR